MYCLQKIITVIKFCLLDQCNQHSSSNVESNISSDLSHIFLISPPFLKQPPLLLGLSHKLRVAPLPRQLPISSLHKFISGWLRWEKKFISGKCTFSPTSPLAFSLHTILDKEDNQQAFVLIKKKSMGYLPPTSAFSGTHFTL